uniref:Uncharacterized protein n=1 Tax=Pseudomonas phage RVTF4 TaxID=3236931 RepID=A0AB39CCS7_9VIRU
MYVLRAYGVDQFGDIDVYATPEIRCALRHWVISVVMNHLAGNESCCLVEEIHYALDYYSNRTFYSNAPEYVDHVVQELIKYYHRFFDYICRYDIVHYDLTTSFHEGVFLVTRD